MAGIPNPETIIVFRGKENPALKQIIPLTPPKPCKSQTNIAMPTGCDITIYIAIGMLTFI